jgi:galactokinase
MWKRIRVSAPGRLCLFGEHQDFLGLSVIALALDLDITIEARPGNGALLSVNLPDLGERDEFSALTAREFRHNRDYLPSVVRVLRREGYELPGLSATVRGTIPINSGTASSSALVVAWTALLMAAASGAPPDPATVACLAHRAEVVEFHEPGGMMDHYTSALGGLLHIDCAEPITVERLAATLDGFVLGDTLVRKQTTATLLKTRVNVQAAVATLQSEQPGFDLRTTPWEAVADLARRLPDEQLRPLQAQFVNRDLCQEARRMLAEENFDAERLGTMLLEHQRQMREGVEVSHPKLDALIVAAVGAGALGGKLNGSGGGGAMFAYAPGRQAEVKAAIDAAGGRGFIVSPRAGVRVEIE